jgi:hypothetical protein
MAFQGVSGVVPEWCRVLFWRGWESRLEREKGLSPKKRDKLSKIETI